LPLFYSAADVFVTASKLEGFGLPVLEAMACGMPVVCTGAGSLTEIVGEAATIVLAADGDYLARAILGTVDPSAEADRIQEARNQALKYSWARTASNILVAYGEIGT
jgi:glycosyltransferase involved in cell wall biosynthesis